MGSAGMDFMGGGAKGGAAKPGSTNPWAMAARQAGKAIAAGGRSLTESAGKYAENVHPVEYRTGGIVRRTGRANHKDERVITADKRNPVEKLMKRDGAKLTDKKRGKKRKERKFSGR